MDENETFIMRFKDGTEIHVKDDGVGNWLSDEVTPEMIRSENITHVEVDGMILQDQFCEGIYDYGDTKGFRLRELTPEEKIQNLIELNAEAIVELAELIGG